MYYHVKIIFTKTADVKEPLVDDFDGAFINDNSETLFLYQTFYDDNGEKHMERYAIPLIYISTVEISPICE